jgi:hypothetical protein
MPRSIATNHPTALRAVFITSMPSCLNLFFFGCKYSGYSAMQRTENPPRRS